MKRFICALACVVALLCSVAMLPGCVTSPDGSTQIDWVQARQALALATEAYTFAVESGIIKPDQPEPERQSVMDLLLQTVLTRLSNGETLGSIDAKALAAGLKSP